MLEVKRVAENRIDLRLEGKLNSDDMRRALDELEASSEGIQDGVMLYEIADFKMPTASAIAVEFGRLPGLLRLVWKFRRCAVLTDKTWLKRVSEFEGALFPGLDIRAFDMDRRSEAEAWLAGEAEDAPA